MNTPHARLPPLNALRVFHTVVRHRSFHGAASELGVNPQIRLLEDRPGAELWPNVLAHPGGSVRAGTRDIRLVDAATMRRATLAGLGIGLISTIDAAEDLKQGKLVAPFGQDVMQGMPKARVPGFHLVLPKAHRRGATIASFCRWIEAEDWLASDDGGTT